MKNNQNPVWNYDVQFDINKDTPEDVILEVFDEDIGKDDFLGQTTIHLSQVVNQRKLVNNWIQLQQCKTGEILLSAEFLPSGEQKVTSESTQKAIPEPAKEKTPVTDVVPTPTVKKEKTVPLPKGTIMVTLHKARDLEKKGKFGKADPYALLNVGKEKFKSKNS